MLAEHLGGGAGADDVHRALGAELRIDDRVERELDRLGVERGAGMESHVVAELEGAGKVVVRDLPRLGESGMAVAVLVGGEELVEDLGDYLLLVT